MERSREGKVNVQDWLEEKERDRERERGRLESEYRL